MGIESDPQQRNPGRNFALGISLIFGNFWFGYGVGVLNPIGDIMLKKVYNIESETERNTQSGYLNNFFALGALAGVLLAGNLSDIIGRRPVLYLTHLIAIGCGCLLLVENLTVLKFARALAGCVAGLYSVGSVILAELLPNSVAGSANAFGYSFLTFAILLAYLIPYFFNEQQIIDHCNFLLAFPIFIPIVGLLVTPMLLRSDTPKFIYNRSVDKLEARADIVNAYSHIYSSESVENVVNDAMANFEAIDTQGKVTFNTLMSKRMSLRLLSGIFVAFAQQVSGINFLIFYSTKLFKESGKDKEMTLVIGLANFFGSFIALAAISRLGRKFNIVFGTLGQGIGFLLLFIGFQSKAFWILAIAVITYMLTFAIGLGGSQMAYTSEILPPLGVSIALAVQWIMTALIGQYMLSLVDAFGETTMILFFSIACFAFFFIGDYVMIETKNKTEDQIAREFENHQYRFLNFK